MNVRTDVLRSGGGRGGADVGCKRRERFVGLMTDPRDDGRLQASQLPHQTLVIESGQVLEGAAAANEQDDVGPGRIRTIECSHKRQRSRLPLHIGGRKHEPHPRRPPVDRPSDVLQRRRLSARHHDDPPHEKGKRLL